jgi:hemoglobin-like flavoprotein
MGAGASTFNADSLGKTLEDKMKALLPDYFIEGVVITPNDVDLARNSWQLIIQSTSPEFISLKSRPEGFEYRTCKLWFSDQFSVLSAESGRVPSLLYNATTKIKENAINGMFNMLLSMYVDKTPEERLCQLRDMANVHANRMGVRCYQYAAVGGLYMKTLRVCLGSAYDDEVETAWKRLFSATLQVLLPLAIEAEAEIYARKQRK